MGLEGEGAQAELLVGGGVVEQGEGGGRGGLVDCVGGRGG